MITDYAFGKISINGTWYHKDLMIIKGEVIADWWRSSGHRCTPSDIKHILEARPATVILGRGSAGMMQPTTELIATLQESSITLIAEPTAEAVKTFNRYNAKGENVAAGFHLTC